MCLGIPGEIVTVREQRGMRMADVRFAGITREVCLDCTPEAKLGDFVLVHVGFAISRIDRVLAEEAYRALDAMGATAELTADHEDRPMDAMDAMDAMDGMEGHKANPRRSIESIPSIPSIDEDAS